MTYLDTLQQFLWIFPTCLGVITLIIMAKRGLYRELPVFTAYLACITVYDIVGALLRESHPAFYFYFFWVGDGLTALLGLCVIYEIFRIVLKSFSSVQRIGLLLFRSFCFFIGFDLETSCVRDRCWSCLVRSHGTRGGCDALLFRPGSRRPGLPGAQARRLQLRGLDLGWLYLARRTCYQPRHSGAGREQNTGVEQCFGGVLVPMSVHLVAVILLV